MYDSWKSHIMLYIEGNENGEMLIDSNNNGPFKLKKGTTIPKGKSQVTGTRVINTIRDVNANQPRAIRCYNYKGEGHIAKQCNAKKRVKESEWFKEKMLLAQAQQSGVILHEEQQDFLADRLEEMDDCDDL
nr:retrovirus-related Pol polyprotein from transposon TNT 1-94 [Tanacetum cinerariifolium]